MVISSLNFTLSCQLSRSCQCQKQQQKQLVDAYFLKSLICSSSNFIYLWHIWTQYCPKCIFWLGHVCAGDIWSISGLSKNCNVHFFACHLKLGMMISRVKLYSYWLWWSRFNFKVWYIDLLKPELNIVAFERYNWKLMAYRCYCTVLHI